MRAVGILVLLLWLVPGVAFAQAADAARLDGIAAEADEAAARGDWATARREWREFGELWLDREDPFRDASVEGYSAIEAAMVRTGDALRAEPPNTSAVRAGLAEVRKQLDPFASGKLAASGQPAVAPTQAGLRAAVGTLARALAAARADDAATAATELASFHRQWLTVEGTVKARSVAVYRSTEDGTAEATALLKASKPADAAAVMAKMVADLDPIAEGPSQYGAADAAIILFREGLEALLVVAALLAFLSKAGHAEKRGWIWGGAAVGVVLSAVAAVAVQALFTSAAAGANRELIEGVTGLLAAAMLVYVSYWLHSNASLASWQRYIRERALSAIAGQRGLISLALISFLAVFREGAETVLFFVGIAPSIALGDLALGLGLGTAGLIAMGVLLLAFGLRIPLRPFFLVSSLLLYYLAFKFVGTGIHVLQVAGVVPATPLPLPSSEPIGLFPTRETTLPQLLLLAVALAVVLWPRLRPARQPA